MKLFSQKSKKPKIGLALGSGGSRGLAHIGVIKLLLDNDIPIDFIAGSSAGALIGALYASTRDIDFVERVAMESNQGQLMGFMFDIATQGGLLSGDRVEQFIRKNLNNVQFDNVRIPFAAVATDLRSGESVVLKEGDVTSAVRASISVPLVFEPVTHGSRLLVDGGLSQPIPVDVVRDMGADIVIGVNLDAPCAHVNELNEVTITAIAGATMNILRHHLAYMHQRDADIVVEPKFEKQDLIGWEDFLHAKDLIDKGQDAMEAVMPQLRDILSKQR